MTLLIAVVLACALMVLEYDERIAMPIWLIIIAGIDVAGRFHFVRLEYDALASVKLVIFGRVIHWWAGVEFFGWGHPFAALFVSDGFNEIPTASETPHD